MFLSIIVPVFNVELYLDECLRSIHRQSYRDMEVILVNDGSTDRSREICSRWVAMDETFRLIDQLNGGVSAARNTGIEQAGGDYILFVDSDDYLHADAVRRLKARVDGTGADLVVFESVEFEDSTKLPSETSRLAVLRLRVDQEDRLLRLRDRTAVSVEDLVSLPMTAWSKIYRRQLLSDFRFPVGRYFEDFPLFFKTITADITMAFLRDGLYFYRRRGGSVTRPFSGRSTRNYIADAEAVMELSRLQVELSGQQEMMAPFNERRQRFLQTVRSRYPSKGRAIAVRVLRIIALFLPHLLARHVFARL